jgi:hypothetical protein
VTLIFKLLATQKRSMPIQFTHRYVNLQVTKTGRCNPSCKKLDHVNGVLTEELEGRMKYRGGTDRSYLRDAVERVCGNRCANGEDKMDATMSLLERFRMAVPHLIELKPRITAGLVKMPCNSCKDMEFVPDAMAMEMGFILYAPGSGVANAIMKSADIATAGCWKQVGTAFCRDRDGLMGVVRREAEEYIIRMKETEKASSCPAQYPAQDGSAYTLLFAGSGNGGGEYNAKREVDAIVNSGKKMQVALAHEFMMLCRILDLFDINDIVTKLNTPKGDPNDSLGIFIESGVAGKLDRLPENDLRYAAILNSVAYETYEKMDVLRILVRYWSKDLVLAKLKSHGEDLCPGEMFVKSNIDNL